MGYTGAPTLRRYVDPQQALSALNQAASLALLNREAHRTIATAVQSLSEFLEENPAEVGRVTSIEEVPDGSGTE